MEYTGQENPHATDVPERSPNSIRNREAIALIQEWYATPDERGEDYWDQLERDIAQNRLRLRNGIECDS